MSRFLFLLFVCGFAWCTSGGTVAAMMSDENGYGGEEGGSYGNDPYNNGGGFAENNGNNGMMMGNGGDMRSQVRSIVDNILNLNQGGGGHFYNNNNNGPYNSNGPYNNEGYGNNYAQYGDDNGYQQNGPYQSQGSQQWNNNGPYNNGDQYNNNMNNGNRHNNGNDNGGNYRNNNRQRKKNEGIALADNREINQRLEKVIKELNALKKDVNQKFSQKNGRNHTDAKDKNAGGSSNKNMLAEKRGGKRSSGRKYRKNGKCNKQIFTVKNIDTCNMRTNSYLSTKGKSGSKYLASSQGYPMKSYSSKSNYLSAKKSTGAGNITYKIKSYAKNADGETSTATLDNKKYTIKNSSYFAARDGCSENKCG